MIITTTKDGNRVVTRIAHEHDWQELIVHFGDKGEPVKYERRVHDPDYVGPNGEDIGCLTEIPARSYARYWAFVQERLANG